MKLHERVCAYIDLDALTGNLEQMKDHLSGDAQIIAVIKTDGYGHGAIPIARQLEEIPYVFGYATATAEESFALRRAGMKKPILCLGYTFPESYERLVQEDVRPALFRADQARQFSEAASRVGKSAKVHIKVDTGMSRIGITPDEAGIEFIKEVMELENMEVEGIFTHFSRADEADKTAATKQLARYEEFLEKVSRECPDKIPYCHMSNSAGIIEMPQAHMDLVRAGIILYGLWPSDEVATDKEKLTPVLTLKSHVVYVKEIQEGTPVSYGGTYVTTGETRVATVPVGYADGYNRMLSNNGYVICRGKKLPIIGKVCMDQFMVDASELPDMQPGDEVILLGEADGVSISVTEMAHHLHTIEHEVTCGIAARVPRVYLE